MQYKIVATTPSKETAQLVWEVINKSKVYNMPEHIINLHRVKEVCEECESK